VTKTDCRRLAFQAFGSGAGTNARRCISTFWIVEVTDASGRIVMREDAPSLRECYRRIGVHLKARIDERDAASSVSVAQLDALYAEGLDRGDRELTTTASKALGLWWSSVDRDHHAGEIVAARARCAEILDTRGGKR
jgi:hypothetical protein